MLVIHTLVVLCTLTIYSIDCSFTMHMLQDDWRSCWSKEHIDMTFNASKSAVIRIGKNLSDLFSVSSFNLTQHWLLDSHQKHHSRPGNKLCGLVSYFSLQSPPPTALHLIIFQFSQVSHDTTASPNTAFIPSSYPFNWYRFFVSDLRSSPLITNPPTSLCSLIVLYNDTLSSVFATW